MKRPPFSIAVGSPHQDDVHLMFSNAAVQAQWLVYEEGGYLTHALDVSSPSA